MLVIDLDNPNSFPIGFRKRLLKYDQLFKEKDFLEYLEINKQVKVLIQELNEFCLKNFILGYHYTRALPEDILKHGLIITDGESIRARFLENYRHLFSKEELNKIVNMWSSNFVQSQSKDRDGRIFFNFTKYALINGYAENLLSNYGGEQIYFHILKLPGIDKKIKSIGTPLIVRCVLNPLNLNTYVEYPWGKIALSSYHRVLNPDAEWIDQDGYQRVPVPPQNIELIQLKRCENVKGYIPIRKK